MCYAILLALSLIALVSAADTTDPEDLGVITANVGFMLDPSPTRSDFHHFVLEFLPAEYPTNKVTIILSNRVVRLEDLVAVPHGTNLLGVRSVCIDGEESPIKLFKLDLRRDAPAAPKAHRLYIGRTPPAAQSLERVVESRRALKRNVLTNSLPPAPGQTNGQHAAYPGPLPNGSALSYSDQIDRMRAFYHRGETAEHKSAL